MALVITTKTVGKGDGSLVQIKYAGLSEADTDPPSIDLSEWSDVSVHISGTFNAGTCVVEGTNDESIPHVPLTDPQGNNLSFTAAKLEQIMEICYKLRPRITTGTGVSVNAVFILKRASSLRN